jgi:hypothetical protein
MSLAPKFTSLLGRHHRLGMEGLLCTKNVDALGRRRDYAVSVLASCINPKRPGVWRSENSHAERVVPM